MKSGQDHREQAIDIIHQIEAELSAGSSLKQACKNIGISTSTYYRWRRQYEVTKVPIGNRVTNSDTEKPELQDSESPSSEQLAGHDVASSKEQTVPRTLAWWSEDGQPTQPMSAQEYREWVHDQVSRRLFLQTTAILSVIGVAGFLALLALGTSAINTHVSTGVKTEVDALEKDLEGTLSDKINGQIAHSLLDEAGIQDKMKKQADEEIKNQRPSIRLAAQSAIKEELPTVRKEAKKAAATIIDDALVTRFRDVAVYGKQDRHLRVQSLRLMLIFASNPARLRSDLLTLIETDSTPAQELRQIALTNYQPGDDQNENQQALTTVLTHLGKSQRPDVEPLGPAYSAFVSRFSEKRAEQVAHWLTKNGDNSMAALLADSLAKMEGDATIEALISLATSENKRNRELGWQGLAAIDPNRPIREKELRRKSLGKLWKIITDSPNDIPSSTVLSLGLKTHLDQLGMAMRSGDTSRIRPLQREAVRFGMPQLMNFYEYIDRLTRDPDDVHMRMLTLSSDELLDYIGRSDLEQQHVRAFVNLLRSNDWDSVVSVWLTKHGTMSSEPSDVKARNAIDILLLNWIERLELDGDSSDLSEKQALEMVSEVLKLPDCLYRSGSARAVDHVLTNEPKATSLFLDKFAELYHGTTFKDHSFLGEELLRKAVDADAKAADKSPATHGLIAHVLENPGKEWELAGQLALALDACLDAPKVQDFLYRILDHLAADMSNSLAVGNAIETLSDLKNTATLPEATDKLLSVAERTGPVEEDEKKLPDEKSKERNTRKKRIVNAVTSALSEYCDTLEDPDPILSKAVAWLSSENTSGLKYTRDHLRAFVIEKYKHSGQAAHDEKHWDRAIKVYSILIELDGENDEYYLYRAEAYGETTSYDEALADYNKIIDLNAKDGIDKADAAGYNSRGVFFDHKRHEYKKAIADFTKAIELHSEKALYNINRGFVYGRIGKYGKGLADYTRVIAFDAKDGPDYGDAQNYVERAHFQAKFGRFEEALADCTKAIEREALNGTDSADAEYYAERGHRFFNNLSQYEDAFRDYTRAIELDTSEPSYYAWRGDTLRVLKRYEEAVTDLTKAHEAEPERALFLFWRGKALKASGECEKAKSDFSQAVLLDAESASDYSERAQAFREMRKYERAIESSSQGINLDSRDVESYLERAAAKSALGKHDEAMEDCDAAIKADQPNERCFRRRGIARFGLGQYREALDDFSEAIAIEPSEKWVYVLRGKTKRCLRDDSGAINDFSLAIKNDADYALAYLARGRAKQALGQNEAAKGDYTTANQIEPVAISDYATRAHARIYLGDVKGAIEDCTRVIKLCPDNANAYAYLGHAYHKGDRRDDAMNELNKAISLDPQFAFARFYRYLLNDALGKTSMADEDLKKAAALGLPEARRLVAKSNPKDD